MPLPLNHSENCLFRSMFELLRNNVLIWNVPTVSSRLQALHGRGGNSCTSKNPKYLSQKYNPSTSTLSLAVEKYYRKINLAAFPVSGATDKHMLVFSDPTYIFGGFEFAFFFCLQEFWGFLF